MKKIYIEFDGNKIKETECGNYQEARFVLLKVLEQCVLRYKKFHNKKLHGFDELQLQQRIMSKLKVIAV